MCNSHSRRICISLVAFLFVLISVPAYAQEVGIGTMFGQKTLLPLPFNPSFNGNAIVSMNMNPSSALGNDWAGALRLQGSAFQGGQYNGTTQTVYATAYSSLTMNAQGQGISFAGNVKGYGKGNSIFGNGALTCWGGGETALPSSTPVCEGFELETDSGTLAFDGLVIAPAAAGMTTVHYGTAHNQVALGARALFNLNHLALGGNLLAFTQCTNSVAGDCVFTGGICPLGGGSTCTVVQTAGALPLDGHQRYFKTGTQNDFYAGACAGDDVSMANGGATCQSGGGAAPCCFAAVWYRINNISDATHFVLTGSFDTTNLQEDIGTLAYLLIEGEEVSNVDPIAHTFTIPANTFNWAPTEILYSPPDFYQGMAGGNFIFRKLSKVGAATAESDGVRIANFGPARADVGMLIEGPGGGLGGWRTGVRIQDMNILSSAAAGVQINNTRGIDYQGDVNYLIATSGNGSFVGGIPKNVIALGASGQDLQYCDTTNQHVFVGVPIAPVSGINLTTNLGGIVAFGAGILGGIHNDGSGYKHTRLTTGAITANTTTHVTVAWGTAFGDTSYTPQCNVLDSSGNLTSPRFNAINANNIIVDVFNADVVNPHTGTLECTATHD